MGSGVMTYLASFREIGSGIRKLILLFFSKQGKLANNNARTVRISAKIPVSNLIGTTNTTPQCANSPNLLF
jgi:hypothetical protein